MGKGIKIKAPKIKIGKDLGMKNLGKAASSATSSVGKIAGNVSKIAESGLKAQGKLLTGDFKGMGKEALQGFTSASNIAGEIGGNVGGLVGDRKTGDIAGRVGADILANAATAGGAGLAKTAAQGLASGGVGGLISGKGLQDAALSAVGSYAGIDPNLMKMGMSATQGDLKGAALSGLGSFGGIDPNMLKMGASALSGDKGGIASGLASQFGAGDSSANMLGAVAGGDLKGAALSKLAGATGLDPKLLSNLSSGKIDPMQLAGAAGLDTKKLLGGAADKLGINSLTRSPAGESISKYPPRIQAIMDKATAGQREAMSKGGNQRLKNPMNVFLSAEEQAELKKYQNENAGFDPEQAINNSAMQESPGFFDRMGAGIKEGIGKVGDFFGGDQASSSPEGYTIQKGDTFNTIAKKLGMTPEQLKAANPNLTDINKIAAGATLNIPGKTSKGIMDRAGSFVQNNPNLMEGLIQGAGAAAGYAATSASTKEQQEILKRQEQEAQQIREMEKFQYDSRRAQAYDELYGFKKKRIAEGGYTPEVRAQQKEDDLRDAKMRQAAKEAGLQALIAKGQGTTGSGQAFATMLAQMEEDSNLGFQRGIAREKQAYENVEKDYESLPEMMEKKSQSEMDLAQRRSTEDVYRATQLGDVRESQRAAEAERGRALATLAGAATDTASSLVKNYITDAKKTEQAIPQPTAPQTAPTRTPASTNVKAAGAAKVAGTPTTVQPSIKMATGEYEEGAGVLATPNADAMNQKYSTAPKPKSGVEQLLGGDLMKQGQQMMSKAPAPVQKAITQAVAPVQQTINKTVDKSKEALSKFGIKI